MHKCIARDLKMDWDLLHTFEAVARLGSLTAAAKTLSVNQSTVSRQMSRLEEEGGSPLFLRESPVRLTERGEALLLAVRPMVEAALQAQAALEDSSELRGQVTLTTVGEFVRWVLAKELGSFYQSYPSLRLRILADNQISSLAAGDADLSLRFAKPSRGDLIAQKMLSESYGYFACASLELHAASPWLGLTGSLSHIPEQRHAERTFANRPPRLLVEDVESLGLAVQAGLGVAILPRAFAARLPGLAEACPEHIGALDHGPIAPRDLWMVVHRSKQRLPKVRALMTWLTTIICERAPS